MRGRRWRIQWFLGGLLLLLLASGSAIQADEGPADARRARARNADARNADARNADARNADARSHALVEMLGLLRLRMEARLKQADILSRAGRLEEALEVLRGVETLYERSLEQMHARLARLTGGTERPQRLRVRVERPPATGEVEGLDGKPFEGPQNGGTIGIGGGAGGAFKGRGGGRDLGTGGDGRKKFDDAVDDALRWLAAHQSPNGGWEAAGFGKWCDGKPVADAGKQPEGKGKPLYDPGVTGLALCAFLGAGYTNRGNHPFAKVVARGLRYLKNIQDPEGCYGPRSTQQYIYNHATASLAMVEAYGMTGSPIFKGSAQRALDFIAMARNPYFGWRYGIKPGDNDTSVTGWMMMSLKSAQLINKDAIKRGKQAPLIIDEMAFAGVKAWLDKVTDPDYGRVGYVQRGTGPARPQELVDRFPGDKSESMTAIGMLARTFTGEDPRKSKIIRLGADLLAKLPPTWNPRDGSIDMYYWYYGSLVMFQVGGKHWALWRKAMDKAILQTQRRDTDHCRYKGSWDPVGPWGRDGGRIYSTALMAMSMQIWYRYDRVFAGK